jgi:predicted RNase H-like HicB family nuclease
MEKKNRSVASNLHRFHIESLREHNEPVPMPTSSVGYAEAA